MSARQGSASFSIVLGGLTALLIGGMVLTFMFYPVITGLLDAAFFSGMETAAGARVTTYVEGLWVFWGGIILISILSYIWVETRQ